MKEKLIREFLEFMWLNTPDKHGNGRIFLATTHITNHYSNDYIRNIDGEEEEKLIKDFIAHQKTKKYFCWPVENNKE